MIQVWSMRAELLAQDPTVDEVRYMPDTVIIRVNNEAMSRNEFLNSVDPENRIELQSICIDKPA